MDAKHWGRRVDPHFGYLRTEFGCEIVDWSDENWWETSVTYQNSTTAIKIACSEEFDRLETDIIRLVDVNQARARPHLGCDGAGT